MNASRSALLTSVLLIATAFASCQRIQEPVPTPTADQWRRVQENILGEAPVPQHPVDATFGARFRLIGWDIEPAAVELGSEFVLTFYWEALTAEPNRWQIFVHLDGNTRQNVDHDAIENLYPTVNWQPGEIIRDAVPIDLGDGFEPGEITVFVGFFAADVRLPVNDPGAGRLEEDGRLAVGTFEATWTPPAYEVRRATSRILIDGRPTDRAWSRAQRTDDWVHPNSGDALESMDTWAKMLWDDTYLYVLMNGRDTDVWATLQERDSDLWSEEVLELYVDAGDDGRDYLELQVNPLGVVFDAMFPDPSNRNLDVARGFDIAGLESAVYVSGTTDDREDRDRSWSAELRIPLTSIPGLAPAPPNDGDAMRVNFYRYDRPDAETTRTAAWSPIGGGSFHQPRRFGMATFRGQAGGGSPGTPVDADPDAANPEVSPTPPRLRVEQLRQVPTPAVVGGGEE